jgi:Tol biopolymer transport system component
MSDVRGLLDEARRDFTVTGDEFDRTIARARRRSRRQRMVAAATALVVAVAGIGFALWAFRSNAPSRPAGLSGNGEIAFVRLFGSKGPLSPFTGDLYAVNTDSGRVRRLTRFGNVSANIAVSPDGTMVAFIRGSSDVDVMNIDGTGLRRLASGSGSPTSSNAWPSWTPDGARVRFYTDSGGQLGQVGRPGQGLWEVNVDGSGLHLVIPNWHPWYPAWSPDGTHIAWMGDRGTGSGRLDVFVAEPDGVHGRRRLTSDPGSADMAAWSPDGRQIAFVNGSTVEVIAPDGSDRRTLFRCRSRCTRVLWPAWAPDGTKLVFVLLLSHSPAVGDVPPLQLWVMNADGTDVHPIPGVSGACCPSWQPIAASAAAQQASG